MTLYVETIFELSDEEILADSNDIIESDEAETDEKNDDPYADNVVKFSKQTNSKEPTQLSHESDPDIDGWGSSKRDYYNADAIETEADALEEEAEARRLQQKQLQRLNEEDFGFDEIEWISAGKDGDQIHEAHASKTPTYEILPELEITDAMDPEERLRVMRIRFPEFELLAKEFIDLQLQYENSKLAADASVAMRQHSSGETSKNQRVQGQINTPVAVIRCRALSAYLAALSMYFTLLTSASSDLDGNVVPMSSRKLREHPIMETLVQCRDLWGKVDKMSVPESMTAGNGFSEVAQEYKIVAQEHKPEETPGHNRHIGNDNKSKEKRRNPDKTIAQPAASAAQALEIAQRLERIRSTKEDLLSLSALTGPNYKSSKPSPSAMRASPSDSSVSSFGEQTSLAPQEALEKAQRKNLYASTLPRSRRKP